MTGAPVPTRVSHPRSGRPVSLATWVALCATGEGVGMTAASAANVLTRSWTDVPHGAAGRGVVLVLVVAGGLIEGLALGVAQSVGLKRCFPALSRWAWIAVTLAVAGVGWALASLPSVLAVDEGGAEPSAWVVLGGAAALGAVMGLVLGSAQALVLRRAVRHPFRWVGANALAWSAAMVVIFLGAGAPGPGWSPTAVVVLGAVTGLTAGGVLGLVTALFLPSLNGSSLIGRQVIWLLQSRAHRLLDHSLVGLCVRGVVTGAIHALPVMFAADADGMVVFPGRAASKRWWRNLRRPALVSVLHDGRWQPGWAHVVLPGRPGYETALVSYQRRWPRVVVGAADPLVRIELIAPQQRQCPSADLGDTSPELQTQGVSARTTRSAQDLGH